MAIEDAAALEILLSNMEPADSVETRLNIWNQMRLPRCAATQFLSNRIYKETEERDEGVRQWYTGPLPEPDISGWSDPWNDLFYRYDVCKEAEKAVKYKNAKDGLPDGAVEIFGPYLGRDGQTDNGSGGVIGRDRGFFQKDGLDGDNPHIAPGRANFNSIANTYS